MQQIILAVALLGIVLLWRRCRRPAHLAPRASIQKTDKPLEDLLDRIYTPQPLGAIDCTPDAPIPFAYKMSWLVVQAPDSPEAIHALLPITDIQPANWATGMKAVSKNYVFVSPPVDGWVFVVSHQLPTVSGADVVDMLTPLLKSLSSTFGKAQYFCSDRRVSYYAWAQFEGGREIRAFASLSGEFIANRGDQTEGEIQLGFDYCDPDDPEEVWDNDDSCRPSEDHVRQVAGEWSVDPQSLDQRPFPNGIGWIGSLKNTARITA